MAIQLDPTNLASTAASALAAWWSALVVKITTPVQLPDVRAMYDALLPPIGTPYYLAEDVSGLLAVGATLLCKGRP